MESLGEGLEPLLEHELAYARTFTGAEQTPGAWFLHDPEIGDWRDANRALRLRDTGVGPEAAAREVVAYYRSRGLRPVADLDEVAEAQGIGRALRRLGVTPVMGERLLMRYPHTRPLDLPPGQVEVRTVPNGPDAGETRAWVETTACEEEGGDYYPLFYGVAAREARGPARLYLGLLDGAPAGSCYLYSSGGWGRVESVVTRPEFRRRGVASQVVARAVADSLTQGNAVTYLYTEAGGRAERLYHQLGFIPWQLNPLRRHMG